MADLMQAEKYFAELPEEKVIVTGNVIGTLQEITSGKVVVFAGTHTAEIFRTAGYQVWCGVEAEPATETVERMAEYLAAESPDTVVASGGGSVLDAAKSKAKRPKCVMMTAYGSITDAVQAMKNGAGNEKRCI